MTRGTGIGIGNGIFAHLNLHIATKHPGFDKIRAFPHRTTVPVPVAPPPPPPPVVVPEPVRIHNPPVLKIVEMPKPLNLEAKPFVVPYKPPTEFRPKLGKHEKFERMTTIRSGTVLPPNVENPWFLTQCMARGQCTRMGCFNIHPWDTVMTARPREINA
jgi:hypothetical protein